MTRGTRLIRPPGSGSPPPPCRPALRQGHARFFGRATPVAGRVDGDDGGGRAGSGSPPPPPRLPPRPCPIFRPRHPGAGMADGDGRSGAANPAPGSRAPPPPVVLPSAKAAPDFSAAPPWGWHGRGRRRGGRAESRAPPTPVVPPSAKASLAFPAATPGAGRADGDGRSGAADPSTGSGSPPPPRRPAFRQGRARFFGRVDLGPARPGKTTRRMCRIASPATARRPALRQGGARLLCRGTPRPAPPMKTTGRPPGQIRPDRSRFSPRADNTRPPCPPHRHPCRHGVHPARRRPPSRIAATVADGIG